MSIEQIFLRRDVAANWATANPVLGSGEPAFATDTYDLRVGDGSTPYSGLKSFVFYDPATGQLNSGILSSIDKRYIKMYLPDQYGLVVRDGSADCSLVVQTAINAASAAGGGVVYLSNGTYAIDGYKGDQTVYSASVRGGLRLPANVTLLGESRGGTILKNTANNFTAGISIRGGANIEMRNFTLDMDWPNKSSADLAFSSTRGEGIIYWNGSSDATDHVIENVTVKNTGHYGLGIQNVAVYRMRVDNYFAQNIGGDAIDIKEFIANAGTGTPAYPKVGIRLTNCWADTIGLNATLAQQEADAAAFDLRGEVEAYGLHVVNLNTYNEPDTGNPMPGVCGIRINGSVAANDRTGGRKVRVVGGSVTSSKAANVGSESVARVIGVRIGSDNTSVIGVSVDNCYIGFRTILTGDTSPQNTEILGCHALNCHGSGGDGRALSLEGSAGTSGVTVDMVAAYSDVGVAVTTAVAVAGRIQLNGNTKDHTITEDVMRKTNLQFVSASSLVTNILRPTVNNMTDLSIWDQTNPVMRLRSTLDGTWSSPYNAGAVVVDSADTSGAGAGVRAALQARMTGATGGGTGWVFQANAGAGLVDVMTINGDRTYINLAVLGNYASDAAAATGGVLIGGLYRNGSILMIRVA